MSEDKPQRDQVVWYDENGYRIYVPTADGLFEKWLESVEPDLIRYAFSGDVEWARAIWDAAKRAYCPTDSGVVGWGN